MATGTGVALAAAALPPSCPLLFNPQHKARWSVVRAQVCWLPALIAAKLYVPVTACGIGLHGPAALGPMQVFVAGPPSCPLPSAPQQRATRSRVIPQLCAPPASSPRNVRRPATGGGAVAPTTAVSPSCPSWLSPQQYATPPAVRAQVCSAPTE